MPILRNHLRHHNMLKEFGNHVVGVLDTVKILKNIFKELKLDNLNKNILFILSWMSYKAHNAVADVSSLERFYHEKIVL